MGDTVTLSMTGEFLKNLGLVESVKDSPEALINAQMKLALDKIAFLPFGKLMDQWRWGVFSGGNRAGGLQRGLVGPAYPLPGYKPSG